MAVPAAHAPVSVYPGHGFGLFLETTPITQEGSLAHSARDVKLLHKVVYKLNS